MMHGCCGWSGWWGFGMGWPGMIFGLLFWILIILVVVWGLRWLLRSSAVSGTSARSTSPQEAQDPKRVLQLRYARGEITREEYLHMLADLEERPS